MHAATYAHTRAHTHLTYAHTRAHTHLACTCTHTRVRIGQTQTDLDDLMGLDGEHHQGEDCEDAVNDKEQAWDEDPKGGGEGSRSRGA
jgi:hypothetical protein